MNKAKEEILRKYLDGDLTAEKEQEALHIIADNEELRSMLRFEQLLTGMDFASYDVPSDFSERVMQAIDAEEVVTEEPGIAERFWQRVLVLFEPREFRLRPAYALAMMVLIAALVGLPYFGDVPPDNRMATNNIDGPAVEQVSVNGEQVWARFVFIDKEANSVSVAGDFSDWNPIELTKQNLNGQQVWTGLVPMDRGEHRYMFVKDGGQWVTDPLAPVQEDDGFGNKNAVIYL